MLQQVAFFCLFFLSLHAAKPDCSVVASDGTKYDLAGLSGLQLECTDSSKEYLYKIDPCAATVTCNNQECTYCQEGLVWNNYYCVGTSVVLTGKENGAGVSIEAVGGEGGRSGKIDITCDPSAGVMTNPTCISPSTLNGYTFSFSSEFACPGAGGGGLSGGSILLIILLVLTIVYFGGGIGYNKLIKQESGAQLVPNIEFWRDFPGLVQEGVLFSVRKIKGIAG